MNKPPRRLRTIVEENRGKIIVRGGRLLFAWNLQPVPAWAMPSPRAEQLYRSNPRKYELRHGELYYRDGRPVPPWAMDVPTGGWGADWDPVAAKDRGPVPGVIYHRRTPEELEAERTAVNLSRLPKHLRGPVWAALLENAPAIAEAIEAGKPLRDALGGGEVIYPRAELPAEVLAIIDRAAVPA